MSPFQNVRKQPQANMCQESRTIDPKTDIGIFAGPSGKEGGQHARTAADWERDIARED